MASAAGREAKRRRRASEGGEADAENAAGVSLGWLGEHPTDGAERLAAQGMLRVNQVIGGEACTRLRELVDRSLAEAQSMHAAAPDEQRWDMCVPLDGSVVDVLSEVVGNLQPLLSQLFEPDAVLCELASLITEGGATRQGLHYDTPMMTQRDAALLITCFIALQDISDDMGPTIMLPHSASVACHEEWQRSVRVSEQGLADLLPGPTTAVGSLTMPVVRCAISAGDVVLMDSRLLHCAGANLAGPRRRLLYFTVVDGGGKPLPEDAMSSMSMFEMYRDKLRLDNREEGWAAHASADGFTQTGIDVFSGY